MARYVGAAEASRRLGVQRATLYAYVSRGLVRRRVAVDGRTSLYAVDDLARLVARARRRSVAAVPRPSIDVQIASSVTTLDDDGLRYRGHDVAALARTTSFERVAELLWTGVLPDAVDWPRPDAVDLARAGRVARAVRGPALPTLVAVASALGAHRAGDDPRTAARRLLGIVPSLLGAEPSAAMPSLAGRLAACWWPDGVSTLAPVIERALVLLADHELATSTLAVRLAGSTWASPYQAYAAGLAVIQGPLHAAAAHLAHELLIESERLGAATALSRRLDRRERIPGFGHRIYQGDDPRLTPLLEAIATLPDPHGRTAVLDDLLREAGARLVHRPNIDLGLGALAYIGDLPPDMPLFAVARIAGFAAHLIEELAERPLRFRGIAGARG
jgi:citrate synthase